MIAEILGVAIAYVVLAPLLGGLIYGIDRRITARMQGRVGPPILQPFYDVMKLLEKEKVVVTRAQSFYITCYLALVAVAGGLFFTGFVAPESADVLIVIFALALAHVMLVLGSYSTNSPYSHIGAERELIQMMAYEPMLILAAVGMYMVSGSFYVFNIINQSEPLLYSLPLIFLGTFYVFTIKLRKSPFDLSTSHHAHQEIVKGITTDFSGSTLAKVEIAHWYEIVFLLGFIGLFYASNPAIAIAIALFAYFLEIFIDNTYARFKWQLVMKSAWAAAAVLGVINLLLITYGVIA